MDHIDFDTEQCLFAPPDSSSSDQMAMAMSIPTQRRLIRKPLPDLPSSSQQATKVESHSTILGRTGSPRQHAITLEESRQRAKRVALEEQKQLDWWPSTVKEKQIAIISQQDEAGPSNLSEYYKRHLFRIIESSLDASGRSSPALARSIFKALEECLDTLATPESLIALHQTYSFLWRVEAMIRFNEQIDFSKAAKTGVRWPRLGGWRGSLSANSNGVDTSARRKKRDIALQLLSGAFWLNGSIATLGGSDTSNEVAAAAAAASETQAGKVTQEKKVPLAAPPLFVKTSLPTVALHTAGGNEEPNVKSTEEEAQERTSTLTSRLAMQLKNSEKTLESNVEKNVGTMQRRKSAMNEEEKILAVCKVCLDYIDSLEEQEGTLRKLRRRRSGTVTLPSSRREQNTSTLSDHTIRGMKRHQGDDDNVQITWEANEFTGSSLFLNPLSSEAEGRDQLRNSKRNNEIKFVGGTFLVESDRGDPEEKDVILNVLDLSLYSASAMMLESALLRNFQLEEQVEQKQPEVEVKKAEEEADLEKADSIPISKSSILEIDADRQTKWPTSIWGMMQYTASDQAAKKDVPTSPQSTKVNLKKPSKKVGSYSGRLGKLFGSFTGSTAKQNSLVDHREDTPEVTLPLNQVEQEEQVEPPKSPLLEASEHYSPPVAISPYFSDQAAKERTEYKKDDYMEHLLSQQSLYLTVLEGMDLSLCIEKQEDKASAQRIPLLTRKSFNDTEEKATGSTTSIQSSSKSTRSSNSNLQVVQQAPVKQHSVPPTSIESNPVWHEKNQREVQFYQRAGSSRDVSLGQAVEEMAAKAAILDKEAKESKESKRSKESKEAREAKEVEDIKVDSFHRTYRIAQYLHNHDRITVMAFVKGDSCFQANDFGGVHVETPSDMQSVQDHDHGETKSKEEEHPQINLWTADIKTGKESTVMTMSEATYLTSYGGFIQAILSHPKFVREKHNVVRIFSIGDVLIKFQVQPIVVFDLLVEGPVVNLHQKGEEVADDKTKYNKHLQDEKLLERTRLEIQSFYSSVKRHISALEHVLVAREVDDRGKTIKPSFLSSRSSIASLLSEESTDDGIATQVDGVDDALPSSQALRLLGKLKKSFRRVEFDLYDGLKLTKASSINDVRIQFQYRARSAKKRLSAWEAKHLSKKEVEHLEPLDYLEPEYFEANKHVFPGSRFLVREDEPLSMIAYTLSSRDFDEEMHRIEQKNTDVLNWRSSVLIPSTQSQMSTSNVSTNTVTTVSKMTVDSQADLDPDKDEDFHIPEPLQIRTKRKKRVKDAGILSLRLKRATSDISSISGRDSGDSDLKKESLHPVGASLDDSDLTTTLSTSRIATSSSKLDTISSSNDTFHAQVAHVDPRGSLGSMFEAGSSVPPTPLEEKLDVSLSNISVQGHSTREPSDASITTITTQTPTQSVLQRRAVSQPTDHHRIDTKTTPLSPHIKHSIVAGNLKMSCVSWFAEDFVKLRQKWNIEDDFINSMTRCKSWSMMGGKSKSGFFVTLDGKWIAKQLLNVWSVDEKEAFLEFAPAYLRYMKDSAVHESPTLLVKIAGVYTLKFKNVKTGEVKLKMSVQVLENVFAGDKGESIRFDIKGIRDRRVQVKKENDGQEEEERAPVWWDGEWLDTFQSRAYVPQSHKMLFHKALDNDLNFLKASNVMDYSLLIGAHEASKEGQEENDAAENRNKTRSIFRVRVVDFLGAFTLAKYIESSGKKAIQSQAPTIIPPHDYAARFANAVETYFIPCPS